MSKKTTIHVAILAILVCITLIVWQKAESEKSRRLAEKREDEMEILLDRSEAVEEGNVMVKVAVPMVITVAYAGFLVVVYVLPYFVDRFTEEALGSTEEVEDDPLHDARAYTAQGDYEEAIRSYREVFEQNPDDRLPIVEISKLQREKLGDPQGAVDTLKGALESKEWRENDAAFFMFRISEIYEQELDNHEGAVAILTQVTEEFPETRHSANATHKLRELGAIG
ncbi:MAG: tetratricopeptide repeat protein [Verrucomicrobiales bacterium]